MYSHGHGQPVGQTVGDRDPSSTITNCPFPAQYVVVGDNNIGSLISYIEQGQVYDKVIHEVCEASRVDFEEGGVDQQTLEEMRRVSQYF